MPLSAFLEGLVENLTSNQEKEAFFASEVCVRGGLSSVYCFFDQ